MFSERFKTLRLEKKLTQNELAKELGVSNKTISVYEKGTSSPTLETLEKIAAYFNVTIDYLIGYSNVRNPKLDNLAKELNLTEEAIAFINSLSLETNVATDAPLSLTFSHMIENPAFIKIIRMLSVYSSYTEENWKTMAKKIHDSFHESDNIPSILQDPFTMKTLVTSEITDAFKEIIDSILFNFKPPTPE